MDLSLIPTKDLLDEVEKRCHCFVCAYEMYEHKKSTMQFRFGKGDWFEAVRLAAILNNDVLNDWKGELQTLQRIHDEGIL